MRFHRRERIPFTDTPRKRAALERKHRLEREALPLFAAEVGAMQPEPDKVMAGRAVSWDRAERQDRTQRARKWRKARAELAAFPIEQRAIIRRTWNSAPYPADPTYLLDFLHRIRIGRVDPANPPFRLREGAPHVHA